MGIIVIWIGVCVFAVNGQVKIVHSDILYKTEEGCMKEVKEASDSFDKDKDIQGFGISCVKVEFKVKPDAKKATDAVKPGTQS
jgi:hypothetical protein